MANKKMTVIEKFTAIQSMLNGETVENFSIEQAVAFLGERIAQTAKKNAGGDGEKKLTKTQLENKDTKQVIMAVLSPADSAMTIVDMQKANETLGGLSNQKISALLSQLVRNHEVERTEIKGKAHFALPTEE